MRAIAALYVARTLLQEAPSLASPAPAMAGEQCSCEEAGLSAGLTAAYVLICITLIILAGMMAGLTLGKEHACRPGRCLCCPPCMQRVWPLHKGSGAPLTVHRLCLIAGLLSIDKWVSSSQQGGPCRGQWGRATAVQRRPPDLPRQRAAAQHARPPPC